MAEDKRNSKKRLQKITFKALKANVKGTLFYGIYFVLSIFLSPISEIFPGFLQTIETFVMVYIFFIIVGELISGTIFQQFFNTAKALFLILFIIFSLKTGLVGITFHNVSLIVDLRLFLTVAMLLSLLGFAKSMLQTIDFLNQRAEQTRL